MRRGQLLSMDALLSLVIVVMSVGAVINTNDMIKAEITNLVDWYDRVNIADNMLDVLVKTPGEPADWEENPENVIVVGLKSTDCYCLDSEKILKLSESYSDLSVISALMNLSRGYDFAISIESTNIELVGNIVRQTLYRNITTYENITVDFSDQIEISTERGRGYGNYFFVDRYLSYFIIGGKEYSISDALLNYGNPVILNPGDKFVFYYPPSGFGRARIVVDNGTSTQVTEYNYGIIEVDSGQVYVNIAYQQGGQRKVAVYVYSSSASGRVIIITGEGQQITKETTTLLSNLSVVFNYSTLMNTFQVTFAVINGTPETDITKIRESMETSPCIQTSSIILPEKWRVYQNKYTLAPSELPRLLLNGVIDQPLPPGDVVFSPIGTGNATFVAWSISGERVQQAIIIVNVTSSGIVTADIVYPSTGKTKKVVGSSTSVQVPIEYIFESPPIGETATLYLWGYSATGLNSISVSFPSTLGTMLKPQYLPTTVKIWVWDDS